MGGLMLGFGVVGLFKGFPNAVIGTIIGAVWFGASLWPSRRETREP